MYMNLKPERIKPLWLISVGLRYCFTQSAILFSSLCTYSEIEMILSNFRLLSV